VLAQWADDFRSFAGESKMKAKLAMGALALWGVFGTAMAADKVEDFSQTIDDFKSVAAVAPYFDSAYGYAVWKRIARGGLGVGAATGKGQVYRNGQVTGFSRLVDITIGFQAGGQAYKQVIFFQDERSYNEFTSGKFEFDAAASAVAVTASAQANAGTQGAGATASTGGSANTGASGGYTKGLQVFTMSTGGLMYQATIGGQKYNFTPVGE
jgi:Las17-binding protein actin regulator